MNNLKRVLSLALSGIMLVGMMAMSASAADFVDADDIVHDEAVNILVALKVINGKDDGSHFDPTGDVTRAEMAKMIAVAMNGGKDTNTGVKGTPSFTDISGHWAESYIEYCYDLGVISGRGDGTFDPNGKVTGMEATKMVLTALGYDATAYRLTGASWAVRTDELARKANPSLYEELDNSTMSVPASRDVAAQLIWNGLQNITRRVTPETNTNSGEVTWSYGTSGKSLLAERYDADIFVGTYKGNEKSIGAPLQKGEIRVNGKNENDEGAAKNADFPSTMGIENIGEEVKVIYKDVKGGTSGQPDKKDTIYGVFNTGKTTVYNIIKNDIQDVDGAKNQIKFGDVKYDYVDGGTIEINYGAKTAKTTGSSDLTSLKVKNADSIKFVCNADGKIVDAYVVERDFDVVAAVTSTKLSLKAIASNLTIADHDVYDGVAKDDVVVVTQLYKSAAKDATFVIEKAEILTGEITKFYTATKVAVDGKNVEQSSSHKVVGDYEDKSFNNSDLTDEYELVMYGKRYVAAKAITESDKDFALVLAANDGDSISGQTVRLLLADGSKKTFSISDDSNVGNTTLADKYYKGTPATELKDGTGEGTLVSYSLKNDGKVKMTALTTKSNAGTYTKATKSINDGTDDLLTTSDAIAFVLYNDEWKVYKAADLNDITGITTNIQYKKNSSDKVPVFAMESTSKVGVNTSDYKYMYITAAPAAYAKGDEKFTEVSGVTVGGDDVTITVEDDETANAKLKKGVFIQYKEGSDGLVDLTDVTVADTLGRVKEYDESRRILRTTDGTTYAVSKDVVVINVNTDDVEAGSGSGISEADPVNTEYNNVIFFTDTVDAVDNVIIAIFVDDDKYIQLP